MKHFYLVQNEEQLANYRAFIKINEEKWVHYIDFLKREWDVKELPQAIIWADKTSATEILRKIPIPAYTNDIRLVMTPDLEVWRKIYLKQLEQYPASIEIQLVQEHYQNLSENFLLQIIGHELAHWSERFADDFEDYGTSIWFEEGMVEYISRKYFLTDEEFEREKICNQILVDLFEKKQGFHSLNDFGYATFEGDYASIFYEYWRSFLMIERLVDTLGTVEAVFGLYQEWLHLQPHQPLLDWLAEHHVIHLEK